MISISASPAAPEAKPIATSVDGLSYATAPCTLGVVLVARSAKGVCAIALGGSGRDLKAGLAVRFPDAMFVADEDVVRDDLAEVVRFVETPAAGLRLTLDLRGTAFQRRVWEKLRAVSVGRTVTAMELARWISPLASPLAVAAACAANPIAFAIPCHRVVHRNGDPAGPDIARHRELLRREAGVGRSGLTARAFPRKEAPGYAATGAGRAAAASNRGETSSIGARSSP